MFKTLFRRNAIHKFLMALIYSGHLLVIKRFWNLKVFICAVPTCSELIASEIWFTKVAVVAQSMNVNIWTDLGRIVFPILLICSKFKYFNPPGYSALITIPWISILSALQEMIKLSAASLMINLLNLIDESNKHCKASRFSKQILNFLRLTIIWTNWKLGVYFLSDQ